MKRLFSVMAFLLLLVLASCDNNTLKITPQKVKIVLAEQEASPMRLPSTHTR